MIHDINKGKNIVYSQFCALYLRIFKYIFRYVPITYHEFGSYQNSSGNNYVFYYFISITR